MSFTLSLKEHPRWSLEVLAPLQNAWPGSTWRNDERTSMTDGSRWWIPWHACKHGPISGSWSAWSHPGTDTTDTSPRLLDIRHPSFQFSAQAPNHFQIHSLVAHLDRKSKKQTNFQTLQNSILTTGRQTCWEAMNGVSHCGKQNKQNGAVFQLVHLKRKWPEHLKMDSPP